MEELTAIKTADGRQFKPWATKDDVQDPSSVNAIASELASGKANIVSAINMKGGSSTTSESLQQLAQDIEGLPLSEAELGGIETVGQFNVLKWICDNTYKNNALTEYIQSINESAVTIINTSSAFVGCIVLRSVIMRALTLISATSVFQGCIALTDVEFPNLATINNSNVFKQCSNLRTVKCPSLTNCSANGLFANCDKLQTVVFGTLTSLDVSAFSTGKPYLLNVTIGVGTNINLSLQQWSASIVLAEGTEAIAELNANLYNNLLTKLYDHSNDGQTRTLRIGWLANVTAENIAYANAKGWTLTT